MKAYDRYANCKIITECDDETSFNCYSYIYGNEYIWYKMGTSWPIRHRFIDGAYFKEKKINLSSLYLQISSAVRGPKDLVIDGNNTECFGNLNYKLYFVYLSFILNI